MKNEELLNFTDTAYAYVDPTYDRQYVNPEISQAESLAFIENLRNLQAQNNAQINQQTYDLGTQVPSNLGGLTGSEGVWQARYQTPQLNATVANLQNITRQTAMNTALANQQAMWQNRYNQAKRALERAQHNYTTTPASTGNNGNLGFEGTGELTDASVDENTVADAGVGGTTVVNPDANGEYVTTDEAGNVIDRGNQQGSYWANASKAMAQIKKAGGTVYNVETVTKEQSGYLAGMLRITYRNKNGKLITSYFYPDDKYPY